MDREVFSASEFTTYAKDKWVLVELNSPRGQPPRADHAPVFRQYGVRVLPTLVALDPAGKEIGRPSGRDARSFVKALQGLHQRAVK